MKRIRIFLPILILIVLVVVLSHWATATTPKIHGNNVYDVRVFDSSNKLVKLWTPESNRKEIKILSKALGNLTQLTKIDSTEPTYWVHVRYNDSSGDEDLLIWLTPNKSATYVPGFLQNGKMTSGGTFQSYIISDDSRDALIRVIK